MKKINPEWRRWEKDVCSEFGFKEVAASGATDNYKGDCKGEVFLVDCKFTERKTYSLTFSMWEKVFRWAVNENRHPMIAVRAELGEFIIVDEPRYYAMTENNLWNDDAKYQKSVSVGKQKRPTFYRLKDGGCAMTIVVSPIEDIRDAILKCEAFYNE